MVDSWISEKIRSFLRDFVGKTLTSTEKMELEVLPPPDHSLAHVRSLSR